MTERPHTPLLDTVETPEDLRRLERSDLRQFADELTRLPAQPLTAMRILRLGEGADTSVAELGRIVEADPVLSARVIDVTHTDPADVKTPHGTVRARHVGRARDQ